MIYRGSVARGFTLIELLVVVFIIGIILGFATLSLGGRAIDDRLQEAANRQLQLFRLASEDANLTGQQLGWTLQERRQAFVVLTDAGWQPHAGGAALRPRVLEEPLRMRITALEGQQNPPPGPADTPQILFLSSGELTPFTLLLDAAESTVAYEIKGDLLGNISMHQQTRDRYAL